MFPPAAAAALQQRGTTMMAASVESIRGPCFYGRDLTVHYCFVNTVSPINRGLESYDERRCPSDSG